MIRSPLAALALALLACAPLLAQAQDQGVTATSIKVGKIGDLKGVNSPKTLAAEVAVRAVFDRVNAAGGVKGRKLELVTEDDQYKAPLGALAAKKMAEEHKVFALLASNGTGPTAAMMPVITEAKIPMIGSTSGAIGRTDKTSSKYFFNIRSSNYDEARGVTTFLSIINDKSLAIIHQADAFGKDGLDAALRAAKDDGIDVKAQVAMPATADDATVTAAAKKALDSGAHSIIIFLVDRPASAVVNALHALKSDRRTFCVTSCGSFDSLASEAAMEGVIVSRFGPALGDVTVPVIGHFRDMLVAAKRPDLSNDPSAFIGFLSAEVFVAALRDLGAKPTREGLVDALNKFKNKDLGQIYIDYSGDLNDGSHATEMIMFGKKKQVVF